MLRLRLIVILLFLNVVITKTISTTETQVEDKNSDGELVKYIEKTDLNKKEKLEGTNKSSGSPSLDLKTSVVDKNSDTSNKNGIENNK